jgi:hypothetical protein
VVERCRADDHERDHDGEPDHRAERAVEHVPEDVGEHADRRERREPHGSDERDLKDAPLLVHVELEEDDPHQLREQRLQVELLVDAEEHHRREHQQPQ